LRKVFLAVIAFFFGIFLFSYWQSEPELIAAEQMSLRKKLISRVNDFPQKMLHKHERDRIIDMLEEVNSVRLIDDPKDLGGQIYGPNRDHLEIGQALMRQEDFHMKRNLIRVLFHESRHWQDLKQSRFSILKSSGTETESLEFMSKMALLEFFAYSDDYKLAMRFNKDNPKYMLPNCAEYFFNGERKDLDVTPEIYGFGRSLMSNYHAIMANTRFSKKANESRVLRFIEDYKNNYKEVSPFVEFSLIDCNRKYGFEGELNQ